MRFEFLFQSFDAGFETLVVGIGGVNREGR